MGIYRRVYCHHCRKDFELRGENRKIDCKHCKNTISLNDKNSVYYIE